VFVALKSVKKIVPKPWALRFISWRNRIGCGWTFRSRRLLCKFSDSQCFRYCSDWYCSQNLWGSV